MAKKISIIISVFIFIIIALALYWNINYIDELVKDGEAYNFSIGSSKNDVYKKIVNVAKTENYVSIQIGGDKDFSIIPINELDYNKIKDHKRWRILIEEDNFLNSIRLDFNNDSLALIYRHKQLFELP